MPTQQAHEHTEHSYAELLGAPKLPMLPPGALLETVEAMHSALADQTVPPFRYRKGVWQIVAPGTMYQGYSYDALPYENAILRPDGYALKQWASANIDGEFPRHLRSVAEMDLVIRTIRNALTSPVATEQSKLTQQLIDLNSEKESLHQQWLADNKDPAALYRQMETDPELAALCLNTEATERQINSLSRRIGANLQHELAELMATDLLISVNANLLALQGILHAAVMMLDGLSLSEGTKVVSGDAIRTLRLAVSESLLISPDVAEEFAQVEMPGLPHLEALIKHAATYMTEIHRQQNEAGAVAMTPSPSSAGVH